MSSGWRDIITHRSSERIIPSAGSERGSVNIVYIFRTSAQKYWSGSLREQYFSEAMYRGGRLSSVSGEGAQKIIRHRPYVP